MIFTIYCIQQIVHIYGVNTWSLDIKVEFNLFEGAIFYIKHINRRIKFQYLLYIINIKYLVFNYLVCI